MNTMEPSVHGGLLLGLNEHLKAAVRLCALSMKPNPAADGDEARLMP